MYEKEIDYIVNRIETNKNPILAKVDDDVSEEDSKDIRQIIEEAPTDLDKMVISNMFDCLIREECIGIVSPYYDGAFVVIGSVERIKGTLVEYSKRLDD